MSDLPSKKERRELARQAQAAAMKKQRHQAVRGRVMRLLAILGAAGAIVGFFLWQSSKNSARADRIAELTSELGCTELASFESLGAEHVPQGEISYPRMPPESGNHRPFWAKTGEHTEPIESETQVHNLEHGHVALQYAQGTPDEIIGALEDAMRTSPQWTIAAPYEEFTGETTLSMTAWRHRIDCEGLEASKADQVRELATEFVSARRDNGPESIPGEVNDPGEESDPSDGETTEESGGA